MKWYQKIALWLVLAFAVTYAGMHAIAKEVEPLRLTLSQCIEMVLKDHPRLQVAHFKVTDAEMELKKLQLDDPRWVAPVDLAHQEEAVRLAKQGLEEVKMQLCLDIERQYYQIIQGMFTVKSKETALEWSQRQEKIVEVKFKKGMVPEKDMQLIRDQVQGAEKDLQLAHFQLETSKMQFSIIMGWELERKFEVVEEQSSFAPITMSLSDAIQYAQQHGIGLQTAAKELSSATESLALKKASGASTLEIQKEEHVVFEAKMKWEQAQKELVIQVRNAYMGLQASQDSVTRTRKAFEAAQKELDIQKIKYEAGTIALLDLMASHNKCVTAEIAWIEAIYNYNLSKAAFNQSIGKDYSLYTRTDVRK